ncbi:Nephrocystin-3 [Xenopus laevis] [Rhizoctonia solani]|uniref:Nephrocystin-3 [Xenopus laevis] n=1 Tax=Rhizoctonia solani TaxID=456999 RepID=A0A0K6GH82_9AGAM|nr:Nephrocystin-3 [Xenopus laevis] [Rhizoctonia solani]
MEENQGASKGLNILCIDGGGVRGLSSLIILQEIIGRAANATEREKVYPHEYFDVIAGTGTGGISACMLGRLRMPIEKAIAEYAKFTKEVFQDTKLGGTTMYKTTKLQDALKTMIREATGHEEETMNEREGLEGCRTQVLIVFAMARHNLNAGLPVLFRSYRVTSNPGPECTIREALHATIAHPDLFKSIDIVNSSVPQSFVGGELGCSNPMAHVLFEANRIYPDRQVASIISIGAGHTRTIQVPNPSRWYRTQHVVLMKDMATDSERVTEEMAARFEGTGNVYFRFSVDQGMQNMKDGSWEKLGEAIQHTKAYLQKGETRKKLEAVVRASTERRGVMSTAHAAGNMSHARDVTKQFTGFKRCPAPTKFYTGREDEVAQLITCMTGGQNKLRVCVIYGLGGTGKTQMALSAIERTWDNWGHVIYLDASSAQAIEKALDEFGKAKMIGQDYKDMIGWLESCGERWLMVFDNADTPTTNIEQYIPARGQRGSVIITTRLPDLANLASAPECVCHISSMRPADGMALLLKIICSRNQQISDDDMKAAEELVQDFGCLALAIVHAGAYIAHSPGMTVTAYRSLFLSQRQRMLDEYSELPDPAKLDKRGDTVYTTWKMCYEQLMPESRTLLWLMAYLHYDGISVDIFKRASQHMDSKAYPLPLTDLESQAQSYVKQYLSTYIDSEGNWDSIRFARATSDLTAYSLIEYDPMNLAYRVHVLVHDWAKTVISQTPELATECVATLLSFSVDEQYDTESLAYKRQLRLRVTTALRYNPDTATNHSYYFKEIYRQTGQWSQMMKLMEQQVMAFQQALGDDDPVTWDARSNLASTYSELGRWNEALDLQTQVMDAHKRLNGDEHPDTLRSMGNLATTYSYLGRYSKAEQLGVQILDTSRRVLGGEHLDTLGCMNNLASTYSDLCRHNEAEQLHVQVFDVRKRLLGENHPDTLESMHNLVLSYSNRGQYDEAKRLQLHVLNAQKQVLGANHPHTLISMTTLAVTHSCLGQHNEAERLYTQVLDAQRQLLGKDHPDTLISMNNLALSYSDLGQYNEAEQLHTQVLNRRKQVLGEEHLDTFSSMNNLANAYSRLGRHNEAEQLHIQVFNGHKQALGEDHSDTLASMSNLASTYSHLGRPEKAKQLQAQLLGAYKQLLGETHPYTLVCMSNLASTYSDLGRHNGAEQLKVQVLSAREQILGEDHPSTLTSVYNLALTRSDLGQWDEAEELFLKAFSLAEKTLGDQHPDTQLYRSGLEWLQYQRKRRLHNHHRSSLSLSRFLKLF